MVVCRAAQEAGVPYREYINRKKSRHTVMCHAAQEAGAPQREYINRKKENAFFTPM